LTLLLDASVWVASKDAEDRYCAASRALVLDQTQLVGALDLTLYEVANALGVRAGARPAAREVLATIAARCGERLLRIDPDLLDATLELAAEHGLTAYDAAYVAAAEARGWKLVSIDVADLVSKGLAVTPDAADYP
jgi:predicted nucleic acid-binding protein